MTYVKLNEEQKKNITNYLESRLGIYGIKCYNFEWEETPNLSFKETATHKLDLNDTGIFKFMLKEANLCVRVWGNENPKTVDVTFMYEHHDGGRNGHDTSIKLITDSNGKVYEK